MTAMIILLALELSQFRLYVRRKVVLETFTTGLETCEKDKSLKELRGR